MCCCDPHPNVNGQPGYKWQPNDAPSVRPVSPPELHDDDVLLYDAPGRCGGLDAHSHHFRVVRGVGGEFLLVRHGGGDERVNLPLSMMYMKLLQSLDETARYWLLHAFYSIARRAAEQARHNETAKWREAAALKAIRTRKRRNSTAVDVWIESPSRIEELKTQGTVYRGGC